MMNENDLISRAAAIEAIVGLTTFESEDELKRFVEKKACDDYYLGGLCDAIDEIKDTTAVDAAPVVHGNWIECYERSRHYYCSNCGKVQGIASIVMKYCPECGAKMAQHPWAGRYADQSGAEYADNPTV